MKKIIALFGLLVLFACTKETPIEKSVSEYVQTNLKDPASYEKISIKVLDTITVGDQIREEKIGYESIIKEYAERNDELRKGVQSEVIKAYLKDNNNQIDNYRKKIAERCKDSSSTETKYYTVSHKYRTNNSFGAKELYNDIISIDKNYKITDRHAIDK
ncbi:hypothetical protein ACHRVZ_19515 [Flavobacterium sp. FlaQc-57]|uniref:hypothetical protein n=1 Tax=Flavobacterium sp. FlaQc-57 TaxID=3374186 RepID=UPI00375772B6